MSELLLRWRQEILNKIVAIKFDRFETFQETYKGIIKPFKETTEDDLQLLALTSGIHTELIYIKDDNQFYFWEDGLASIDEYFDN